MKIFNIVMTLNLLFGSYIIASPIEPSPVRFPLSKTTSNHPFSGQQQLLRLTSLVAKQCESLGVRYDPKTISASIVQLESDDLVITCLWPALVQDLDETGTKLTQATSDNESLNWGLAARLYDLAFNKKRPNQQDTLTLYTRLLNTHRYLRQSLPIVLSTSNPWYGPSSGLLLDLAPAISAWLSELTPWSLEVSYILSSDCSPENKKCRREKEQDIASLAEAIRILETNPISNNLLMMEEFVDLHKKEIEPHAISIRQTLELLNALWGRPQPFLTIKAITLNGLKLKPQVSDLINHLTIGYEDDNVALDVTLPLIDFNREMITDSAFIMARTSNHPLRPTLLRLTKGLMYPSPRMSDEEIASKKGALLEELIKKLLNQKSRMPIPRKLVNPDFQPPILEIPPQKLPCPRNPYLGDFGRTYTQSSKNPFTDNFAYLDPQSLGIVEGLEAYDLRERFGTFQARLILNSTSNSSDQLSQAQKNILIGYLLLLDIRQSVTRAKEIIAANPSASSLSKSDVTKKSAQALVEFFNQNVINRLTQ